MSENLSPLAENTQVETNWRFDIKEDRLLFEVSAKGSVSVDFAETVVVHSTERKNESVPIGDGVSLDHLIAGLPKKALNDLAMVLVANLLKQINAETEN